MCKTHVSNPAWQWWWEGVTNISYPIRYALGYIVLYFVGKLLYSYGIVGHLGSNLSWILIKVQNFSYKNTDLKFLLQNGGHFVSVSLGWRSLHLYRWSYDSPNCSVAVLKRIYIHRNGCQHTPSEQTMMTCMVMITTMMATVTMTVIVTLAIMVVIMTIWIVIIWPVVDHCRNGNSQYGINPGAIMWWCWGAFILHPRSLSEHPSPSWDEIKTTEMMFRVYIDPSLCPRF